MSIIEQRQIKILWIIFAYVLVPGFLWQLWFKFQQAFLVLFRISRQSSGKSFLGDRD